MWQVKTSSYLLTNPSSRLKKNFQRATCFIETVNEINTYEINQEPSDDLQRFFQTTIFSVFHDVVSFDFITNFFNP
jgi:hypothetical protein